ncbi:flavin reductase family protein [Halobacillus sp. Nhm2S1]|uniref:flavin reductase family protein n=1 Tax=Halobacillus sp. Nhm2S1 TaxID=2866716 RepID=UPI001C734104|nr:flavin reductase family protein [Halobacillus sp. Nhm2S1]MBX0358767.1 flavin reductase family protein [Halobacillus sp. Nhm2S1]
MNRKDHVKMHSYPGMVAVVGVFNEGKVNFMAAGWHAYLSMTPPMYGVAIGRERHTYKMVKQSKRFTINFLPFEEAGFIQYSGTVSGVDVDKDHTYNQSWTMEQEGFPLIEDAYLAYECKVHQIVNTGDHDWVIGDIEGCHYKEENFLENGLPNFEKLNIPLYLGRSSYMRLNEEVQISEVKEPLSFKKS